MKKITTFGTNNLKYTLLLTSLVASMPAMSALEEIIVTAQKRAESVNEVGMSISAIGGNELALKGINNVEDLVKVVPGLTFARSAYSTPVYTLRGVGFFDTALAASPAVSVYVDEIPLSYPALTSYAGALDVERVEVLKGPQGILFGQNSTGGAINYIAQKPTEEFEAGIKVGYGRFESFETEGFLSGSISESLTARLAVKVTNTGPWQQNYFSRPGDEHGERDEVVGRLLVEWKPSDSLTVNVNLNAFVDKGEPAAGQYTAFTQAIPDAGLLPGVGPSALDFIEAIPRAPHNARAADWSAWPTPKKDENMWQSAVRADYIFENGAELTSITSYAEYDKNSISGDDGIYLSDNELWRTDGDIKDFFQEIRLSNKIGSKARFVLGANYSDATVNENNANVFPDGSAYWGTQPLNGVGFAYAEDYSEQNITSYAVFGNLDYEISDTISVYTGARFTNTEREFEACTGDPGIDPVAGDGAFAEWKQTLVGVVYGLDVDLGPGDCLLYLVDTNEIGPYKETLKEDNVSWRVGVDYKPNDSSLFYGNITKGFKAGSGPNVSSSVSDQYPLVSQESVLAYEIGAKQELFDRSLLLTGALFLYDYKDKQLKTGFSDVVFGTLFKLDNIPESSVRGAEVMLSWAVIDDLNFNASITYLDSKVDKAGEDYINAIGATISPSGDPLPYTPELSATASIDYTTNISDRLLFNFGVNATYNDETQATLGSDQVTRTNTLIASFSTIDMRIGLSEASGAWSVLLWVDNVTDKYYWNNVVQVYDTTLRYAAMPRTYGVRASYNF